MLLLTGSRTALFGLGVSLLLPSLMRGAVGLTVLASVIAGSLVAVAYPDLVHAVVVAVAAGFSRTGHAAEITTFTGRIEIWRACVAIWWLAPWFGYGLGSPRTVIPDAWSFRWGGSTGSAHNFVLESLLSFGVVGTALLLAFVAALAWTTLHNWTQADGKQKWLPWVALSALLFALTNGLMEKSFAGMLGPNTVLLALVCGTGAALQRRAPAGDVRSV
jgi:O-antigen ligase